VTGTGVHRFRLRVYYEDTDFSGVVYHANYLRFLERARSELVRELGIDQKAMFAASPPAAFAVASMRIDWRRPAVIDDELTVETRLEALRAAGVVLAQRILRGSDLLVEAGVDVVFVSEGRARRMPPAMREAFAAHATI